ncbi:MAG: hypothetical protein KF861_01700 [Planctomycetaceae bacterium]|nr:hypothetical protein [Planctomycetaceae bacterium]
MDNRYLLLTALLLADLAVSCSSESILQPAGVASADETATAAFGSSEDAASESPPQSDAALPLPPFGKFQWTDTLGEAITKARKIEGAAPVEVVLLHRRLPAESFDGEGRIRRWLGGLIAETQTYHRQFQRQSSALPRPYFDVGAVIEAKNLSLVGVPFVLKVTFTCEPGLIVLDPARVRKQSAEFFGPEIPDDVPLVLSQVELLPSGVVSPEAHREIIDTLLQKYGPLRIKNPAGDDINSPYLNLTFRDANGDQLDLYPGGRLLYRNGAVHRDQGNLAERFREHQHDHDEQQRKARTRKQPDTLKDL